MPYSTDKYRFEGRILAWAAGLSQSLAGHPHFPFLMLFSDDGRANQVLLGHAPERHPTEVWEELRTQAPAWLLYDPFEGPVYTYVAWHQVAQRTMERLLGTSFRPEDFVSDESHVEFPPDWGVMF